MPSPVVPADFEATIPSPSASLCERFKAFLSFPRIFLEWFQSVYDAAGEFTLGFRDMIKAVTVPVGAVVWWPSPDMPEGWLLANGADYDRTQYVALFTVIGTRWGSSSVTTFKVPNCQGRVLVGHDGSTFTFGTSLGEDTHTLTANEIPALTIPGYQNTTEIPVANTFGSPPNAKVGPFTDFVLNSSGGQSHNNIQRSLVGHWIIKY